MKAREIMSAPVVTVEASTPLKVIAALLVERDISAVPVVEANGTLVGIVSEADLVSLQNLEDPRRHLIPVSRRRREVPRVARDVMTTNVLVVSPDDDVTRVARLMHDLFVKRIPVVSDGRVVGIVSRRDVLKVLARSDASIEAELQEILDKQIVHIGWVHADVADGIVTLVGPKESSNRPLAELVARSIPGVVAVRFRDVA